jgi:predicted  nucleic acid-binding Zn-ribbon protein
MQGDTKTHVEALMAQLGAAQDLIEEKERLEREAANEITSLTQAHEEEKNLRVSLEASVITLEESNNAIFPNSPKTEIMLLV